MHETVSTNYLALKYSIYNGYRMGHKNFNKSKNSKNKKVRR